MKPKDVPETLVDDAVGGWHDAPHDEHGRHTVLLDDVMRHVLAAAMPSYEALVRAKIAEQIEAQCVDPEWPNDETSQNGKLAAAIARGES